MSSCGRTMPTAIVRKDDRRLRRLAETRLNNLEEVRADHRLIRQDECYSAIEDEVRNREGLQLESEEEDDADAFAARRRQIKEKNKKLREREEQEEEEEEEEALSQEEEEALPHELATKVEKPRFVRKRERYTIAERERVEAEERDLKEAKKKRLVERRIETKQIVVKEIPKDKEFQENMELEANVADMNTDEHDKLNEAEEYKAWIVREIGRIK